MANRTAKTTLLLENRSQCISNKIVDLNLVRRKIKIEQFYMFYR